MYLLSVLLTSNMSCIGSVFDDVSFIVKDDFNNFRPFLNDDFNNFRLFLIFSNNSVVNVDAHAHFKVDNYLNRKFYGHNQCGTTALKVKNATSFETKSKLEVFNNYYSTLAENLLKKLPIPPNIYTFNSVRQYYRHFIQNDAFYLTYMTEIDIEKILRGIKVCKAAGRFLKDGSRVSSKPISELCNLSIKLGSFPDACKIAKLKPLFKKGSKTNPSNYRPISLLPSISKVIEKLIH